MLDLPEVTLACIETRNHALMKLALDDAVKKVRFGAVLVMTDRPELFSGCERVAVEDAPSKLAWEKQRWCDLPGFITTNHTLFMEWDAGIYLPEMWTDDFLFYDYIGAPWWYQNGLNVGNGGFSLRSQRLGKFLAKHEEAYPCREPGDEVLCRRYRPALEMHDFRWAPDEMAHQFAFECGQPHKTFGFHAMRNWPLVLDLDELNRRHRLAQESAYIANTGMLEQLYQRAPHLASNS